MNFELIIGPSSAARAVGGCNRSENGIEFGLGVGIGAGVGVGLSTGSGAGQGKRAGREFIAFISVYRMNVPLLHPSYNYLSLIFAEIQ